MKRKTMSRVNLLTTTAVAAYIGPKLAKDKKFDVVPYFKGLTAKTYAKDIKGMLTNLCKDALPAMAPEAAKGMEGGKGPDDVIHMLAQHIIGTKEPSPEMIKTDEMPVEGEMDDDVDDNADLMQFLEQCGLDPEKLAQVKEMLGGGEKEPPVKEPGEEDAEDDDMPDNGITKEAMDKAIKKSAEDTAKRVRDEMNSTIEARDFVRPWVGVIALTHDTAVKVLHAAAATLKIDGADKVNDTHALKLLIKAQKQPGSREMVEHADDSITADADTTAEFAKRWPGAARVGLSGM